MNPDYKQACLVAEGRPKVQTEIIIIVLSTNTVSSICSITLMISNE